MGAREGCSMIVAPPPVQPLRSLRVSVRPDPADCPNPYLRLFYQALEPSGVEVVEPLKVNDGWLRDRATTLDAIHIHWPETIWRPSPATGGALKRLIGWFSFLRLAGRLGIKRIWTVHNIVPHEARAGVDFLGSLTLARSADLLICHSEDAAEAVRRRYRPRGTIVVMQHGNFDGVYPLARPREIVLRDLALDPHRPVVACLGEQRPYKGLDVGRAAFERLGGAVQWIVAGQPHVEMPAILGDVRSADAVVLNRRVSDQEFADITSAADLVWLPYHRVTGSSVILASLTLGTAVVASDLPFFRDVLAHNGPAGHLVPAGDAGALADATMSILGTPREARRAAALAIAARFDWKRTVTPVANVFSGWLEAAR
jgi:beta-1,4-mannosyltransferase